MDPAPLSPIWNLEHYLRRIQRKLQARTASRGASAIFAAALLLTLVCVYVANEFAFSDGSVIWSRLLLFGAVIAVIVAALLRPLRRLDRKRAAEHVERSVPAFDGRVETFVSEAETLRTSGEQPNPFLDLLAEDTLQVAETAPVEDIISWKRIGAYAAMALVAFFTLIWLGTSGPGYWGYGTSRLWAGWLQPNESPLYQINVSPGDATVRQGADLIITAEISGFQTPSASLYAKYADSLDWEQAPMRRQQEGSGYEFLFASLREPLRYYVTAGGVRSDEFAIDVVSMPVIKNLKLTYHYPSWTGMKDVIEDPGGDINAVQGAEIEVEIETDKPLADGMIQLDDGRASAMTADELTSTGRFEVIEDGRYHIAAIYNGEPVRISEDYFITLIPDRKPTIKLTHPGRDYQATAIEEVVVEAEAEDDFGLSSLDLYYSVNGSEMKRVRLGKRSGAKQARSSHTFFLEEMGDAAEIVVTPEESDKTETDTTVEAGGELPVANLVPGDLISYYAVARDHKLSAQTDMFFVETRAFDRSFSQSQAAGGGMGGGQQQQNEISRRQKEIIAATWNLIKKSQEAKASERREIRENSVVLSDIQLTLRDQARTLVERVRARELAGTNPQFTAFIENLEKAAGFMEPAAEQLGEVKLRDAIAPEQKALQFLLRAEAIFRDVQLAFGNGQGQGGGQAQLDLAEMFELEMDLHKNQYETGGGATQQQLDRKEDELANKLKELARRQEKLAERRKEQERPTFADRWQQEMLRREALELKRELEELQRQRQAQQQGQQQQGQQGQQGQQQSGQQQGGGQSGQQSQQQQSRQQQRAGASGSSRRSPNQNQASLEQIIQQLDQATRDMQSNSSESEGQRGQDAVSARRAQERLEEALQQLSQQRQQKTASGLSDIAERAERLATEQRQIAERLREDMVKALEKQAADEAASGVRGRLRSSLSPVDALELSEQKKAMQEELEAIERKIQESIRSLDRAQRETTRTLREALGDLQQNEVATRLRVSAEYIRRGLAPHAAQSEEVVTRALDDLQRKTQEAKRLAQAAGAGEQQGLERSLAQLESLRRRLEQAAGLDPTRPGQQGPGQQGQQQGQQPGQQPGQGQQGQQGQQGSQPGQQPGQQPGGQQRGSQQSAQSQQGQGQGGQPSQNGQRGQRTQGEGQGGPQRTIGGASNYGNQRHPGGIGVWDDETRREMERALSEGVRSVPRLARDLRTGGIYKEDLAEIRNFVRGLGSDNFKGNPNLLAQEYRRMLTMLEQLELQVRRQVETEGGGQVRAEVNTPVPEQYREAVAEYFRRLSRAK